MNNAATLYSSVRYAYTTIPTYPCGQIGFILAVKDCGRESAWNRRCRRWFEPSQSRNSAGNAPQAAILLQGDSRSFLCASRVCTKGIDVSCLRQTHYCWFVNLASFLFTISSVSSNLIMHRSIQLFWVISSFSSKLVVWHRSWQLSINLHMNGLVELQPHVEIKYHRLFDANLHHFQLPFFWGTIRKYRIEPTHWNKRHSVCFARYCLQNKKICR